MTRGGENDKCGGGRMTRGGRRNDNGGGENDKGGRVKNDKRGERELALVKGVLQFVTTDDQHHRRCRSSASDRPGSDTRDPRRSAV